MKQKINFSAKTDRFVSAKFAQKHKATTVTKTVDRPAGTFEKAAKPLMAYLAKNHHPHVTVIVTSTGAELMEGLESVIAKKKK